MNESFKKSETSYKSQDTIAKLNGQDNKGKHYFSKIYLDDVHKEQEIDKENINFSNISNKSNTQAQIPESSLKRNEVSEYSSRSKSNFMSRDESNSILALSDDMITIEDTYKETEEKITQKLKSTNPTVANAEQENGFLPNNYLINHMEMNIIEEQVDEENKS